MTITLEATVIFAVIFLLSLLANAVLIWYARTSILQFAFISENIQDLKDSLESYSSHLKSVYELEMFYGDETLGALMEHTQVMQESMTTYDEFYNLFGIEAAEIESVWDEIVEEEANDAATQTQG